MRGVIPNNPVNKSIPVSQIFSISNRNPVVANIVGRSNIWEPRVLAFEGVELYIDPESGVTVSKTETGLKLSSKCDLF